MGTIHPVVAVVAKLEPVLKRPIDPNSPINHTNKNEEHAVTASCPNQFDVHHLFFTMVLADRVRALPKARCFQPSLGEGESGSRELVS